MSCHKEEEFNNLRLTDKWSQGGDAFSKKGIVTFLREFESETDFS